VLTVRGADLTPRALAWSVWGLCLALELTLCRVSDAPLAPWPVLEELLWFVALGVLAIELPRLILARFAWSADVTMLLLGTAIGGLWLVALRFGLRPHGRLSDLEHWIPVFAILSAYSVYFVSRSRVPRLVVPLVALQGLLVALGVWGLGAGGLPVGRLIAFVLLAAVLIEVAWHPRARSFLTLIGIGIALFPIGGERFEEPRWTADGPVPEGPDVFLIAADTLRADASAEMALHARLAADGVDLSPAQASSPWTLPSMGSVLTGNSVSAHGAMRLPGGGYSAIRRDVPTLAEHLADAGYDTAAVLARNPNVAERYGFARGFALFDFEGRGLKPWSLFPLWGNRSFPVLHQLVGRIADSTPVAWTLGRRRFLRKSTASEVVERARWVIDHRRERPLFLWLHLMDPHVPYLHLHERELTDAEHARLDRLRHESPEGDAWFDDERNRDLVRRIYRDEVARMDEALVELIDSLGPAPPRGRLIVLTADHGEELWDHGGFEHGHSFHQEVTGVPLVLSGLDGAASVETPASLIDLAPTILRAAGLSADGCDGVDLAEGAGPRSLAVENLRYAPDGAGQGADWESWFAVRDGELYLHDRGERALLFDLSADPGERNDLSGERPDDVERMRERKPTAARTGEAVELGADEREALRALGYME